VLDFGFLKEEMLRLIDEPCDHGFLVAVDDEALLAMLAPADLDPANWLRGIRQRVSRDGFCETGENRLDTKLYIIDGSPTAEVLARHWFERLAPAVRQRSGGIAELTELAVYETPNCVARYRP
jgi:6-pyruvoyltetrahydropterin/6-carboxytetrahydropterin synthase